MPLDSHRSKSSKSGFIELNKMVKTLILPNHNQIESSSQSNLSNNCSFVDSLKNLSLSNSNSYSECSYSNYSLAVSSSNSSYSAASMSNIMNTSATMPPPPPTIDLFNNLETGSLTLCLFIHDDSQFCSIIPNFAHNFCLKTNKSWSAFFLI